MIFELNPQFRSNLDQLAEWEQRDASFIFVQADAQTATSCEKSLRISTGASPIDNRETIGLMRGWFGEFAQGERSVG